jgi:hypothetical protein
MNRAQGERTASADKEPQDKEKGCARDKEDITWLWPDAVGLEWPLSRENTSAHSLPAPQAEQTNPGANNE